MELMALIENYGPFDLFFTLSCGDYRYDENFTSLLQDQEITYIVIDGVETCLINGLLIKEFLEQNSSMHEFIRTNILTATRNFDFRVKTFLKTVIMNQYSNMPVKMYSFRVEFQGRGSAHIHGVIWLDIAKLVEQQMKSGNDRVEHLQSALETIRQDMLPNIPESKAIEAYIDIVATCSLKIPETKNIAEQVNFHHHTKTCNKRGEENCRFHFPRFPSLRTIIAVPIRLKFTDDEQRKSMKSRMKNAFSSVKEVLQNKTTMDEIESIHKEDIQALVDERIYMHRASQILNDEKYKSMIMDYPREEDEEEIISFLSSDMSINKDKDYLGELLLENLQDFHKVHEDKARELQRNEDDWLCKRLGAVLLKAKDLYKILEVDDTQPEEVKQSELMAKYHQLLGYSLKGFTVVLKRDISEVMVNNFNSEWLYIWNSNLDISPVFDFYAVVTYISDYYMKVILI